MDFSAASLRAVDYAARFAGARHAQLIVLHVIEPVYYGVAREMYGIGVDVGDVYSDIERAARAKVARIAATMRSHGVPVRCVVARGTAHEQIVEQARKLRADLVILSTHGRSGLSHLLIGSVADRVVRTAPVPVLTVPVRRARAARRRGSAATKGPRAPASSTTRGAAGTRRRSGTAQPHGHTR